MEKCEYMQLVCCKVLLYLGFEVLAAVMMSFNFWDVTLPASTYELLKNINVN
jgi:hypothetical protein